MEAEKKMQHRLRKVSEEAERYFDEYRDQMDLLAESNLAKVREAQGVGLSQYDIWALGKQLEAWDIYEAMCEDTGNLNLLGKIPTIAHDVITAVQGASILPIIASVQPIDDEQGIVWFKNIRSADTRGSQTAGDTVLDPRSGVVSPSGYASNQISGEVVVASTTDMTTAYGFTLAAIPVRSQTLKILTSVSGVEGEDVGPASGGDTNIGRIFGAGISGTVNYTTGAVALDFAANPGGGETISANYQQNFEASTDIPQMDTFFDSKTIQARIYALKGTIGMFQAFGLSKRFGMVAEDELAKDLVAEINREVGGDLIRKLRDDAVGVTTFDRTAPSGVSFFEHKQTYKDALANAEATLVGNLGRGTISVLIVGRSQAAIIQTLPGFTKLFDGQSLGAHVYGTLDGITVVRVTETALLAADDGIALWKGPTPFEAACVWSPFMPLTVTGTLPEAPNPLVNMKAAAVWAGVDSLLDNAATRFNVITS